MADNVNVTPGTGVTMATDDIGGIHHQRVKIGLGADGSSTDAVGGSGAATSGTIRTVAATDDPGVTLLDAIEALLTTISAAAAAIELATEATEIATEAAQTSLAVMDDWDNNDAIKAGGFAVVVSSNFNRPADTTPYASGDLVANSTTAGSVVPLSWSAARYTGGSAIVRRARLKKSTTSISLANFRLHLYADDPSAATGITNGDNGAWLTKIAGYLGSIDIIVNRAFSDASSGNGIPNIGSDITFIPVSGSTIYGLLEARDAYVPGNAETFTVELEVHQN